MGNSTSLDNNLSDSQSDTLDAFSDIDLAGLPLNDANTDVDLSNDIPDDVIYSNNVRLSPNIGCRCLFPSYWFIEPISSTV